VSAGDCPEWRAAKNTVFMVRKLITRVDLEKVRHHQQNKIKTDSVSRPTSLQRTAIALKQDGARRW
jgi:hypothetical protein